MEFKEVDAFPDILTVKHIAEYLSLSRKTVYELLKISPQVGGIPSFNIGGSKRVEKKDFIEWMESRKKEKMTQWQPKGNVKRFAR
jgi:excisionase family DNA binding protein